MKTLIILLLNCLVFTAAFTQNRSLFVKPKVHVGNGEIIEQGLVGVENGKIVLVTNALTTNYSKEEWDTIIECKNHHLYPGFFAPNQTLGLTEIDAVRATRDFQEVGEFNPHIRAVVAFNVESRVIPTVRSNGVLFSQASPRGKIISGASSVMKLDGWNWEDAVVREDDGIHLNWPKTLQGGGWWAEPAPKKTNEKYQEEVKKITDFFDASIAYNKAKKHDKIDFRFQAMNGVLNKDKRLYIHVNELKAILDVIDFVSTYKIKHAVIVGGYDSYMATDQLRDAKIPVMLKRVHALPENADDPVDLVYRLPKLLHEGGVKFCLQNSGSMESMGARNLPFLAGTAMAYGLKEEEAVRSLSLSSAEILGVDDRFGSIEEGKNASLFVSKGNALDMRTNDVKHAMIDGKFIPLSNHQLELYEKYRNKYKEQRSKKSN